MTDPANVSFSRPVDATDLRMMSAAKDVKKNNGIGMWLGTQVVKAFTFGSETAQNDRALYVANQVLKEFVNGDYKEAIGHLNNMDERQLQAFSVVLDKSAETDLNGIELKERIGRLFEMKDGKLIAPKNIKSDKSNIEIPKDLKGLQGLELDKVKSEQHGTKNWRNTAEHINTIGTQEKTPDSEISQQKKKFEKLIERNPQKYTEGNPSIFRDIFNGITSYFTTPKITAEDLRDALMEGLKKATPKLEEAQQKHRAENPDARVYQILKPGDKIPFLPPKIKTEPLTSKEFADLMEDIERHDNAVPLPPPIDTTAIKAAIGTHVDDSLIDKILHNTEKGLTYDEWDEIAHIAVHGDNSESLSINKHVRALANELHTSIKDALGSLSNSEENLENQVAALLTEKAQENGFQPFLNEQTKMDSDIIMPETEEQSAKTDALAQEFMAILARDFANLGSPESNSDYLLDFVGAITSGSFDSNQQKFRASFEIFNKINSEFYEKINSSKEFINISIFKNKTYDLILALLQKKPATDKSVDMRTVTESDVRTGSVQASQSQQDKLVATIADDFMSVFEEELKKLLNTGDYSDDTELTNIINIATTGSYVDSNHLLDKTIELKALEFHAKLKTNNPNFNKDSLQDKISELIVDKYPQKE